MTRSLFIVIVSKLCDTIKEYYDIDYNKTREILYNSKLYNVLEDEKTKMWYFSNHDLFLMFKHEYETGKLEIFNG